MGPAYAVNRGSAALPGSAVGVTNSSFQSCWCGTYAGPAKRVIATRLEANSDHPLAKAITHLDILGQTDIHSV
jgi:hypothetical protein